MAYDIQHMPGRKPKRGGDWTKLLGVLILTGLAMLGATAVFAPWAFYTGGHLHWLPIWQGWGKIHSEDGDYWLYVYITPSPSGAHNYLSTAIGGSGTLCTPQGNRLQLKLRGGMARHLPTNTTGLPISFEVYTRRPYGLMVGKQQIPAVALKGMWDDREILATVIKPRDDPENPTLKGLVAGAPVILHEVAGYSAPPCPKR
jgi:hypothetical protein